MTVVRQDLCERALRFAAAVLNRSSRLIAAGPAQAHIAQQLFQSVSSIGANLEEGRVANSRRDMGASTRSRSVRPEKPVTGCDSSPHSRNGHKSWNRF